MLVKIICAECGEPLATVALQGQEQTVEVHTCRCKPHILDERAEQAKPGRLF